jgi:ATP-dependent protease HslVU (ClpYQ) peptidase subunit
MTVIAARKTENAIVFAADTLISNGYSKATTSDIVHSKLFEQNGMVIGSTGDCYESTFMELFSRNHKPVEASRMGMIDFLVEFREWIRKKEGSFNPQNGFLIAFDNKLFRVIGGLEVYEVNEFDAIGAGQDFAKAAMHLGHSPRQAVEVACKLSLFCSEPITEISVDTASGE